MRNMSFSLTTPQILARTKTVTRRIGWTFLKPGDRLCAIEKGQGLKKGETVRRLAVIEVVNVRQESLRLMFDEPGYGLKEVWREGFPSLGPGEFVEFFCRSHRWPHVALTEDDRSKSRPCTPDDTVTRIEFKYVEEENRG